MKYLIKYQNYIKEGLSSENIINMMVEIILERINIETIESNFKERYKQKPTIEYTYKRFFNAYKDNDFIKQMLIFFKENNRDPKIIFRFQEKFSYNYQTEVEDKNGFYNSDSSNIQINIYMLRTDINKIKRTLSHELRHLYDDVIRGGISKYDKEENIPYKDKPSEIRARITGFINSYTDWNKDIKEIIADADIALKTTSYDRKKLLKLLYAIKNTGIKKHTIIPTKKLEGRKSDIDKFIKEMNNYSLFSYYRKEHKVIEIKNDILSINTFDENTGEIGYPLLDLLFDIYDKKRINIVIGINNLELVDIIKTKYKMPIIRIETKRHWSNKNRQIKYLVSKEGKIPNYEKIADTEKIGVDYDKLIKAFYDNYRTPMSDNLVKYCTELGLSESYTITLLQKILDVGKYIYLYADFYNKWEDRLDFSKCDIHYFEIKNNNGEILSFYLINGERDKSILMNRLEQNLNYKKIK